MHSINMRHKEKTHTPFQNLMGISFALQMRGILTASLLAFLIFTATSISLVAQTVSATLVGTVTDSTGGVTPNAKVTIKENSTNVVHEVTTNGSGNYTVADLPPGNYAITIESQGFKRTTRSSVDLIVNTTSRVDFELQPGGATEEVTVTDSLPLLQTDRADVTTKLEQDKMENLPIGVNRNFQALLNLVPGAAPATFQHSQFFNAQSSLQTEINGIPRMGNSYQIEGIDDNERTGLLQIIIPPADAIQTVDISTNNFEAELGRATGAVTNVTLKSGTNKFHGSLSEYHQNSYLNARSYFASNVGHLVYNYFGGNIGGPIFKDKLFFYGDYFRTEDHEANANTMTIPFKKYYTCNSGYIDLSDGLTSTTPGQIYDPATGAADGSGRTAFANNQIPCGRVNAVSQALLNLLPAPNRNTSAVNSPLNNYFVTLPFQKGSDTADGKVDWQMTPKDRLSGRYSYQKSNVFQAPAFSSNAGGPANGAFAGTGIQKAYSTGGNYTHTFSNNLLTELRIGVAHLRNDAQPTDYNSTDATNIGIPGVNIDQRTGGQVGINLGSFSSPIIGYAASMPWVRGEANIDFVNNWTFTKGNHTFKWGADVRRVRDDLLQGQTYSPRGVYTFGETQTSTPGASTNWANDMASFLLDRPSTVGRDLFTYFPSYRQWWIFAFVGDKWNATPRLTVDYGIRWEFYPPATARKAGQFSNYDPSTNNLVIAGIGNNPANLGLQTHYNYFAPRTGFAFRVNDKTVLRGGFGMSYMPFEDNNYAYNYPVRANNSYQSANSYQPALLADGVTTASFQAGFPAPVAVTVPSNGLINMSSNSTLNASAVSYIPQNFKNPYVESYNLFVQRSLPGDFSLSVGYVGNHGVNMGSGQNINLPSAFGNNYATAPQYAAYGKSAAVNRYFVGTSTNYNSLQVSLNKRMSKGFSNTTAFTWGKGLGLFSGDDGSVLFFQKWERNYGPMDYDRKFNLQESFTYELPFGKGKRFLNHGFGSYAIGGWKLSSVISIVSGTPFTVTANGVSAINTPGWTQTANLTGSFKKLGHGPGNKWFDTSVFSQPTGCPTTTCPYVNGVSVGNTGRNAFRGPGYIQNNASIFKTFPIYGEKTTLDIRMDVFQVSNTPQFSSPVTSTGPDRASLNSATFGQITSVVGSGTGANGIGGGRALQLGAVLKF